MKGLEAMRRAVTLEEAAVIDPRDLCRRHADHAGFPAPRRAWSRCRERAGDVDFPRPEDRGLF